MTDTEMTAGIASALGWVETSDPGVYRDRSTSLIVGALPDWLHSLDACARDLLPVAAQLGYSWRIQGAGDEVMAVFEQLAPPAQVVTESSDLSTDSVPGGRAQGFAQGLEPARALCEAWLAGPAKAVTR